jgi:SOUL heme-binding protein
MGAVFGKHGVAEPVFEVLYTSNTKAGSIPYELRKYGQRFAAETTYTITDKDSKDQSEPFMKLARYIGVFGKPENMGEKKIAMTAPVAMKKEEDDGDNSGTKIAMTAPVTMKTTTTAASGQSAAQRQQKTMQFILPAEYTTLESIPKPTNPDVHIRAISPAVGAVHRFAGSFQPETCRTKALQLAERLRLDGLADVSDDFVLGHYESWGYDPPFTLPMFRRNEVWIALTEQQVEHLVKGSADGVDVSSAN